VTIALATVTWRYVVPDVAAILRKKRSVDTVPYPCDTDDGAGGPDKPAVSTRDLPFAQILAALFVEQAPNIRRKVRLCGCVVLCVARVMCLEVSEHFHES